MSGEKHSLMHRFAQGLRRRWWVVPILFVLQSVAVILAIRCDAARWLLASAVVVWLLFVPVLLIHMIVLIRGRHWKKLIGSFVMELIPAGMVGVFLAIKIPNPQSPIPNPQLLQNFSNINLKIF